MNKKDRSLAMLKTRDSSPFGSRTVSPRISKMNTRRSANVIKEK